MSSHCTALIEEEKENGEGGGAQGTKYSPNNREKEKEEIQLEPCIITCPWKLGKKTNI